jgi:hypothetical protein
MGAPAVLAKPSSERRSHAASSLWDCCGTSGSWTRPGESGRASKGSGIRECSA